MDSDQIHFSLSNGNFRRPTLINDFNKKISNLVKEKLCRAFFDSACLQTIV